MLQTRWILIALYASFASTVLVAKDPPMMRDQASAFAKLALKGIQREFPNKPDHVINSIDDVRGARAMHPAFYGCYDWHSSVHAHWMLARLLRLFPDLPEGGRIRKVFAEHFTVKSIQVETDYFKQPNRQSFERTYGWAWLLKLAEELHAWDDPSAREWARNLAPLEAMIVDRYHAFLPKQNYPIRTGVHPNTAFGLAFAHDYARARKHDKLQALVEERARIYFADDEALPAVWEPNGADFFSPALMEADLMRRVLTADGFRKWLMRALPTLPRSLREPATVTDRTDPQLVHLDGLNLSRAWCINGIVSALAKEDPIRVDLVDSQKRHSEAGLKHVASGDYAGEHWLASFAVYLLTEK